jgi:hypothetical protein
MYMCIYIHTHTYTHFFYKWPGRESRCKWLTSKFESPGSIPDLFHLRIVVDEMAVGKVYIRIRRFSLAQSLNQ